eukprot:1573437-Lingulodinium_polyedra.AAC.1
MARQHAEVVEQQGIYFSLADSSPQGGTNWLLCEAYWVHGEQLWTLSQAVTAINASVHGDSYPGQGERLEAWADAIRAGIHHHIYPPTGLGSRHASLRHKAHCLLHQKRLECNTWRDVVGLLKA